MSTFCVHGFHAGKDCEICYNEWVAKNMVEHGLYAAYRAQTKEINLLLSCIGNFTDNTNLLEPRAHVTVIYSTAKLSYYEMRPLARALMPPKLIAIGTKMSVFDAPSQGDLCALVLELNCPELYEAHKLMLATGLTHTHAFQAHISLGYGLTRSMAKELSRLYHHLGVGRKVELTNPYVEKLNES